MVYDLLVDWGDIMVEYWWVWPAMMPVLFVADALWHRFKRKAITDATLFGHLVCVVMWPLVTVWFVVMQAFWFLGWLADRAWTLLATPRS